MKPTEEQQKLYNLKKAELILEDYWILEASQKNKIKAEKTKNKNENKILNSKKNK